MVLIKCSSGWSSLGLQELWDFRELFFVLLTRKFKGKHRKMAFGYLWLIAVPLINMVVFSFIFGKMAKLPSDGFPYPVFIYVALLPWQLFAKRNPGCLTKFARSAQHHLKNLFSSSTHSLISGRIGMRGIPCLLCCFACFYGLFEISFKWQIITLRALSHFGWIFRIGFWIVALMFGDKIP